MRILSDLKNMILGGSEGKETLTTPPSTVLTVEESPMAKVRGNSKADFRACGDNDVASVTDPGIWCQLKAGTGTATGEIASGSTVVRRGKLCRFTHFRLPREDFFVDFAVKRRFLPRFHAQSSIQVNSSPVLAQFEEEAQGFGLLSIVCLFPKFVNRVCLTNARVRVL